MAEGVSRGQQLEQVADLLGKGQWCAVVAPRYSGKTVYSEQLHEHLSARRPAWQVCRVEFREVLTPEDAWTQIESALGGGLPADSRAAPATHLADRLADLVRQVQKPMLCLLLDGIDELPDEVLRIVAAELRRLRDEESLGSAARKVRVVLLGAAPLRLLALSAYSPLYNQVAEIALPDLDADECGAAFREGLRGRTATSAAAEEVYRATAGHPQLVGILSAVLARGQGDVTPRIVESASRRWSHRRLAGRGVYDCLDDPLRYLESELHALGVVVDLLDQPDAAPTPDGVLDPALLCGALIVRDGQFAFRGSMFEEALRTHLDAARKADYFALHGEWDRARGYYAEVDLPTLHDRRRKGFGRGKKRLTDLLAGLLRNQPRLTQVQAEQLATETALHVFGATSATLWRKEVGGQPEQVAQQARDPADPGDAPDIGELVRLAISYGSAFTLTGNRGVVQGLVGDAQSPAWALELRYAGGLPKRWVLEGLQSAEALLHSVLDRARSRDSAEAQRRLVHRISLSAIQATAVDEVLRLVVDGVRDDLGYECAQLSLLYPAQRLIRGVMSNGAFDKVRKETKHKLGGGDVLALVVRGREPRTVLDCSQDRSCHRCAVVAGIKSQAVVPLLVGNEEAIGALQVGSTVATHAFGPADLERLAVVADIAATAIRMAGEREALEQALSISGDAMVWADATGHIRLCSDAYADLFGAARGDPAPLTQIEGAEENMPLVRLAYERGRPMQAFNEIRGRSRVVTGVGLVDAFRGYAGGLEVIATRSPFYGLTDALTRMLSMRTEFELGQAIVDCACQHLGYSQARLYRMDEAELVLRSTWSAGMTKRAAKRFDKGGYSIARERSVLSFACLHEHRPVIILRQSRAERPLPAGEVTTDAQGRRVLVMPDDQILFDREYRKVRLGEWLDAPLWAGGQVLGKLTVDRRADRAPLTHEDVELITLFSRWASEMLARVVELESVTKDATVSRSLRNLGGRRSLVAIGWDFLVRLTLDGALGFNRAALWLRDAQTGAFQGFLCHGAANREEWHRRGVEARPRPGREELFIQRAIANLMQGEPPTDQARRLRRLNEWIVNEAGDDPLARAIRERVLVHVPDAVASLGPLYQHLQWQPAPAALVCPLVHRERCEGMLYVDQAFLPNQTFADDRCGLLMAFCSQLAVTANAHRTADQLRSQVMGLAHAGISPFAAIRGLAQPLARRAEDPRDREALAIIAAEAERGADAVNRLLAVVSGLGTANAREAVLLDLGALLKARLEPYLVLMRAAGALAELDLVPVQVRAEAELLGLAVAEPAANANRALRTAPPGDPPRFLCRCTLIDDGRRVEIRYENTSARPAKETLARALERGVSGAGGTGFGLGLVKEIM